jgi:hypothetical protein
MPFSRRTGFHTQAPREATLVIAVILWLIGFADVILGAIQLGGNYGLWAMAAAGLLLIIGSLVDAV